MAVRILEGDCRKVLRTLPAASVDCVITDPPYGQTDLPWDVYVDGWLQEVRRVLRPAASLWCFGSMRFFIERAADFREWRIAQDVIWEKHNGSSLHNDRFRRVHETVVQFYPSGIAWGEVYKRPLFTTDATARTVRRKSKPAHWHGIGEGTYRSEDGGPRLMRSVMLARSEHHRAVHPTQKPIATCLPLVEYSCPPGGVVLDCFCGSGTVGIAAQRLARSFVGIEMNPAFVTIARDRIADDGGLFEAAG